MSEAILSLGRSTFGSSENSGRLMPIEEANALLNEWVGNERLRLQVIDACRSVANDIACFSFPSLHHASADFCVQAPIRHGSSASNVLHCIIVTTAAL